MIIWWLSRKTMMNRLRWVFQVIWEFIIDITTQAFSSITIPPVIKTVKRNGRTLVYRIQNDEEIPLAPQLETQSVSHPGITNFANLTISSAGHFDIG